MKKILIVEDDKKIVMALTIRLRAAGYEVVQAYDVISGTSMAIKHQPQLILLDISMPGGNGFDIAERIQNRMGIPANIIFLTAHKEPELREKAMQMGAAAFFEKPYDPDSLLNTIVNFT
ncbi:MAG: response regulator [Gammaproteobacteria bacterium]|nr:response regulator [Gammaproteobacteria bacterium]